MSSFSFENSKPYRYNGEIETETYSHKRDTHKYSKFTALTTLLKTTIDVGYFSIQFGFIKSGVIWGPICLLTTLFFCYYSLYRLDLIAKKIENCYKIGSTPTKIETYEGKKI